MNELLRLDQFIMHTALAVEEKRFWEEVRLREVAHRLGMAVATVRPSLLA